MKPYEKTFRNSFGRLIEPALLFILLSSFAVISFFSFSGIFIRIIIGVIWATLTFFIGKIIHYFVRWVKITDEEITVQKLFGSKSFRWDEIERISRRGEYLFFHNYDGKTTLSIGSEMNGYAELLELFFKKHAKLFRVLENEPLSWDSRNSNYFMLLYALLFFGASIYFFYTAEWFLGVGYSGIVIYSLFNWPRITTSIIILDDMFIVTYPFREKSYYARWIEEITLGETKPWGQVSQFVKINLKAGKSIDLRLFPHNGLLAYRRLKRWHKKALKKETAQIS